MFVMNFVSVKGRGVPPRLCDMTPYPVFAVSAPSAAKGETQRGKPPSMLSKLSAVKGMILFVSVKVGGWGPPPAGS